MGSIEELKQERRQRAIEELRCHKVGILIQIIDRLEGMNLSVREIDTILRTCGLNDDCAIRFGVSLRAEKEEARTNYANPIHP